MLTHRRSFLEIGATYGFVMHSLLALSASHLAWLTGCPLTANMVFEHRGIALKGLRNAIGSFLRENSDAILAASLLLSWQATEWLVEIKAVTHTFLISFRRDWTRLMHGTSSVNLGYALGINS
jgi:transcription factor-like protein